MEVVRGFVGRALIASEGWFKLRYFIAFIKTKEPGEISHFE